MISRYENQVSHNQLLVGQLHDLRQKITEYKDNLKNFYNRAKTGEEKDSIPGEIQQTIAKLTREKYNLESKQTIISVITLQLLSVSDLSSK